VRAVVLVEGVSDKAAVEALARRRRCDLAAEGVSVVAMGGVTNILAHLRRFGPEGLDLRVTGVCDAGEAPDFARRLASVGLGAGLDRAGLAALGFHVCERDLEDELIRALGVPAVMDVVAGEGELRSFRTLQRQVAQQDRSIEAQLHRFLGSKGGRKIRYARLLVDALDLDRVPGPLDRVLADARTMTPRPSDDRAGARSPEM
jgi:hypothetical protein